MKTVPKSSRKRFDTDRLNDIKTKHDFRSELRNRFRILQSSDIDEGQIDEHWKKKRDTFNNASERVMDFRKQVHIKNG